MLYVCMHQLNEGEANVVQKLSWYGMLSKWGSLHLSHRKRVRSRGQRV